MFESETSYALNVSHIPRFRREMKVLNRKDRVNERKMQKDVNIKDRGTEL